MKREILIIDKKTLENVFLRFQNKSHDIFSKLWACSLSVSSALFLSNITTNNYNDFLFLKAAQWEVVFWVLFAISTSFLLIASGYLVYMKYKNGDYYSLDTLHNNIVENNLYVSEDTYIFLIPIWENDNLKFAVRPKENWDNSYFFPYLKQTFGDKDSPLPCDSIIKSFSDKYNINIPLKLDDVSNNIHEVTKIRDRFPRDINFKFLYIRPVTPFLFSHLKKTFEEQEYRYISISELQNNKSTELNNGKVLNIVQDIMHKIKKLYEYDRKQKTKLIWNIDKSCSNKCPICAYGNENLKIGTDNIDSMLQSLQTIDIDEIDISMGDNVDIDALKDLLEKLRKNKHLKISVTANASVLSALEFSFLNKNINEIEITYDYPKEEGINKARPHNYNKNNLDLVRNFMKSRPKFSIIANIVIHEQVTTEILKKIKKDLKQARISKITYLRLMPIGNVDWSSYPKCLNELKTYTLVQRDLQSNNTHLHCALHTALDASYKCRMGIGKLGLSPNGLLYMCAWAEHLKDNKNNEFYLGNILDEDCSEILSKNEVYNNFIRHPQARQCKIFNVILNRDLWDESEQLE